MFHDPYSGQQIKAYRRDPTGRWSPIIEEDEKEPWYYGYIIGVLGGIGFAAILFLGV
jgi:hypothetical protein